MAGPRLNPYLLQVSPYIAGRSIEEVQEEYGLTEVVKLASNESPVGPSPKAIDEAGRLLQQAHRYPGAADRELRRKLARRLGFGLAPDQILMTNGGTDALRLITQAFVFDGGNTIMSRVTFPMYHILTTMFGGTPRQVSPRADYRQDLEAMAEQIDDNTRVVYLCSPNNPTGEIITQTQAEQFLARVPEHVIVVFDESYCDYVTASNYASTLSLIEKGYNVLGVRSFSKSAGLANLRIGYLFGPAPLVEYLQRSRVPFHVGDVALAAAAGSLEDGSYHECNREAVLAGRAFLQEALAECGLCTLPTQANFVTIVDPPVDAPSLTEALLRQGIIVRLMTGFGLPEALRVSVGSRVDNEKFILALRRVLPEEAE